MSMKVFLFPFLLSFFIQMCFSSLSLSPESASVIHFPQTSWGPPPSLSPLSRSLFLSLLQCLSLPVRSGKNTAEGRNGILWPEATRRHTDNGGTSFLSAPPWSGPVMVSGQQTRSARGFYGTLTAQDPHSRGGGVDQTWWRRRSLWVNVCHWKK